MPQGMVPTKDLGEVRIHLGHRARAKQEVLLTALLARQTRSFSLALGRGLIQRQRHWALRNRPGHELLAGYLVGSRQHNSRMVGKVVQQKASEHQHGANSRDRMQGLGQLTEVEGLGGLIKKPLALINLVPLGR